MKINFPKIDKFDTEPIIIDKKFIINKKKNSSKKKSIKSWYKHLKNCKKEKYYDELYERLLSKEK